MDYFAGRRMKVLTLNSPSYIKAEFGSSFSMSFGNAQGEVEANIIERNNGSYVNLNISFHKEYLVDFVVAVIGAIFIYGVLWWIASIRITEISPLFRGNYISVVNWLAFGVILVVITLVMGISGYNTSLSRTRFMNEFNMFIQSLPHKKD
jgi:hypothetical protein